MIIIMKPQATEEQIASLCESLREDGMQVQRNAGVDCTVLGVLGGGYAGTVTKDAMVTVDGKTFLPLGGEFKMRFDYRRLFMGTRYAVFNFATKVKGGQVKVKNFQF